VARCPSCDYPLPENRERLGARCPSCHDPLYDPPSRFARRVRPGEAACAYHPDNESVGNCVRCGDCYCETCRSRFANQILCMACVEKALAAGSGEPAQERTHSRQALLSLVLGLGTWLLAVVGLVVLQIALGRAQGGFPSNAYFLCVTLQVVAGLLALFGLGLGAAAIRVRGRRLRMASGGRVLSGLYVGALIGIMTHSFW
jgi:hypothetical protein